MATISQGNLMCAIKKAQKMNIPEKERVCDEILIEQPNLLASVLVLNNMGNTLEEVEVLLNILIVLHLAVKESGVRIEKVSEEAQERQLNMLAAIIKFTEGMDSRFVDISINQYFVSQDEKILLAYVLSAMKDAKFFENKKECSKYLIMAGLNLVKCIINAKKIT